jgi:hypothetical protein
MKVKPTISRLQYYLDQIMKKLDHVRNSEGDMLPRILDLKTFAETPFVDRVLLLSHCLRPGEQCTAKFSAQGLLCRDDCEAPCTIGKVRRVALSLGYKGVNIAAGGSMALHFVREKKPRGILAVACFKELTEGVEAVAESVKNLKEMPAIVVVQLTKDGCINTEVNEQELMDAIHLNSPSG